MKFKKLTEIMQIKGVRVYAHWSLLLIGTVILIGAVERPAETLSAWTAYFSVILIHEYGHMIAAHRRGYAVLAIELYPIHGFVRFQQPRSRYDSAVIACGGVAAQAMVAVPLVTWVTVFGFTRFGCRECGHRRPRLLQSDRSGVQSDSCPAARWC